MMLFPDDAKLDNVYMAQKLLLMMAELDRQRKEKVPKGDQIFAYVRALNEWVGIDALFEAVNGPGEQEMKKIIEKRSSDALLAGAILFIIKCMAQIGPEYGSVNKALLILSEGGDHLKSVGGEKLVALSCSKRKLRSVWSTYRSVSHLWSIPWFLDAPISDFNSVAKFISADFQAYISLSEDLRKWAESHIQKHGEKFPLLRPKETYKVPEWVETIPV